MPKIVDHDRRRSELVAVAWRVIARHGLQRTTLQDVAAEAGFANGAMKPYFPTKDALLGATFEYVYERTNERVLAATVGLTGRAALLAFAEEVLPLSDTARDEARVVLEFWGTAVHTPRLAEVNARAMATWRTQIRGWLDEEAGSGAWITEVSTASAANAVLVFLLGAQITATIDTIDEIGEVGKPAAAAAALRGEFGALIQGWLRERPR